MIKDQTKMKRKKIFALEFFGADTSLHIIYMECATTSLCERIEKGKEGIFMRNAKGQGHSCTSCMDVVFIFPYLA